VKHPFPGPGLAVRLLGAITKKDLETLREADAIVVEEIRRAGLYEKSLAGVCGAATGEKRGRHGRWKDLRIDGWLCGWCSRMTR